MEVVYSLARHPFAKGRKYQNPRHFTGVLEDAKHVYIDGDHPKVAQAYKKAGVPVSALGPTGPEPKGARKTEAPAKPEA